MGESYWRYGGFRDRELRAELKRVSDPKSLGMIQEEISRRKQVYGK